MAEKNSAQTNRQTNRHYENNGHLAVNQLNCCIWLTPTFLLFYCRSLLNMDVVGKSDPSNFISFKSFTFSSWLNAWLFRSKMCCSCLLSLMHRKEMYTVSKNVITLSYYNCDIHESIFIIFGANVTEKVIKGYFIFQTQLTSASALPGEMQKHKNSIISLKWCTIALSDFNSSWLNLFSLVTCNSCSCRCMTL